MGLPPGTSPTKSTAPSPRETSAGRNHRTAPAGGIPGGTIPATRLRALFFVPPRKAYTRDGIAPLSDVGGSVRKLWKRPNQHGPSFILGETRSLSPRLCLSGLRYAVYAKLNRSSGLNNGLQRYHVSNLRREQLLPPREGTCLFVGAAVIATAAPYYQSTFGPPGSPGLPTMIPLARRPGLCCPTTAGETPGRGAGRGCVRSPGG